MYLDRIRDDARQSSTEDLLDQVTVFRAEMEPMALDVLETELFARGVTRPETNAHALRRETEGLTRRRDGTVIRCSYCRRPAIDHRWKWYRLWGWFVPLFPQYYHLCKLHVEELPTDAYGRVLHYESDEDPA